MFKGLQASGGLRVRRKDPPSLTIRAVACKPETELDPAAFCYHEAIQIYQEYHMPPRAPHTSDTKSRKVSRRSFLQRSAGAALAVPTIATGFSILGADVPSNKITIGFIGTGNNGTNWMGRFLNDERMRVTTVCDVNREGAGYWGGSVRGREPAKRLVDKHYGGDSCQAVSDFRDVISDDGLDCIYIGTPDHWHAIIAIAAAKAKKHIYGQKPLSLTVAEGRAMSDAVRENGVVWQTGSQQRSDRNFRRACELVRNGRIGKLHTVRCGLPGGIPDYGKTANQTETVPVPDGFDYDMWLGPAPEAEFCPARVGVNFRWNLDYSGGQLTDWGGHHPDIAQWGMGTELTGPVSIRKARGKWAQHPIYNTATEYYFQCVYANGVRLIISNRERGGVTFEGSEGQVWADRGRHDAYPKALLKEEIGDDETKLYVSDNHVKNFIDCVVSGKPTVAPIEIAHRSITLAHLGNIALITGRDLDWDPDKEEFVNDPGANALLGREYRKPWSLDGTL